MKRPGDPGVVVLWGGGGAGAGPRRGRAVGAGDRCTLRYCVAITNYHNYASNTRTRKPKTRLADQRAASSKQQAQRKSEERIIKFLLTYIRVRFVNWHRGAHGPTNLRATTSGETARPRHTQLESMPGARAPAPASTRAKEHAAGLALAHSTAHATPGVAVAWKRPAVARGAPRGA